MPKIILIIHNVRSAHNVGSLLRTADGLGIERVIFSGYSPYPAIANDKRLPHIADRVDRQIRKTSLGAEKIMIWNKTDDINFSLNELQTSGYVTAALEQTPTANNITDYRISRDIALIVGNEVSGLEDKILRSVDVHLQIPMMGSKESFNVAVAGAIALYHLRYTA